MIHGIKIRIPEVFKIKTGMKDENNPRRSGNKTWYPPKKLDHYHITHTRRLGVNFEPAEALMRSFGDECRTGDGKLVRLPIILHSDEIDENFPTEYACYSGAKRVCHGDGRRAQRRDRQGKVWLDTWSEVKCTCPALTAGRCKAKGRLHSSLLSPAAPLAGAQAILRTASEITVSEMLGSLLEVQHVVGGLAWVPLWLVLMPKQVEPDGRPTTVYCSHVETIEHDVTALQRQILERRRARAELGGASETYKALVAAHASESDDEQAEINAEFYPESLALDEAHDIESGEAVSDGGGSAARETLWVRSDEPKPAPTKPAPPKPAPTKPALTKPAANPESAAPAEGVEIDESLREFYELQDAHRSDAAGGAAPPQENQEPAPREPARAREPGDDDDDAVGYGGPTTTTHVPDEAGGQGSLLGEQAKPAAEPKQGNAALRGKLSGKNGGGK